jgi:hypothetical protein
LMRRRRERAVSRGQTRTVSLEARASKVDEDVAKKEGAGWNREIGIRLDEHVTRQIRA